MSIQMYPSNYELIPEVRVAVPEFDDLTNDEKILAGYYLDKEGWYKLELGYPTCDFPRALIKLFEDFFECKLYDEDGGCYFFDGTALQLNQFIKYIERHPDVQGHSISTMLNLKDCMTKHNSEGFYLRG